MSMTRHGRWIQRAFPSFLNSRESNMAVSADVMDLVSLLDSEGFLALAPRILTEIALGREDDPGDGGAHFYLCGDASRTVKDVDTALKAACWRAPLSCLLKGIRKAV
ncbi:hypothetical protein EV128_10926 [Rhizobium azibense]|nr:hypothetical protein EV128_10926 [Rhizobium azibense]